MYYNTALVYSVILLYHNLTSSLVRGRWRPRPPPLGEPRSRTNGVNTNGASAKVLYYYHYLFTYLIYVICCCMGPLQKSNVFLQFGEKITHWHFWGDKSRLTGVPQKSPYQITKNCSDPISAYPICPFPIAAEHLSEDILRPRRVVSEPILRLYIYIYIYI